MLHQRKQSCHTTCLSRLRQDGLVTAGRNSRDKRYVNVTLTEKGCEVLSHAMPAAREIVNQVMLSITEGDSALLEKVLRVLIFNTQDGVENFTKRSQPQSDRVMTSSPAD